MRVRMSKGDANRRTRENVLGSATARCERHVSTRTLDEDRVRRHFCQVINALIISSFRALRAEYRKDPRSTASTPRQRIVTLGPSLPASLPLS